MMSFQTCIFAHFNCCVRQGTNLLPSFVIGKYPSSPCVSPQPARRPCALLLLTSETLRVINAYYAWRPSLNTLVPLSDRNPRNPNVDDDRAPYFNPSADSAALGQGDAKTDSTPSCHPSPSVPWVRQFFFLFLATYRVLPCQ